MIIQIIKNCKESITKENDTALITLQKLLNKLVNPGDDYGFDEPLLKIEDYEQIFEILSKKTAIELNAKNYSVLSHVDLKMLSVVLKATAYYINDLPEVIALDKMAKKILSIELLVKTESLLEVTYAMSIYLALAPTFHQAKSEREETAVQWIIGNFTDLLKETDDKVFHLNIMLDFLATMMDKFGMNHFYQIISFLPEDTLLLSKQEAHKALKNAVDTGKTELPDECTLETLILSVISISHEQELQNQTFINFLTLVRKVIPNDKIVSERQFLIDEIVELAKEKVVLFEKKL